MKYFFCIIDEVLHSIIMTLIVHFNNLHIRRNKLTIKISVVNG
jgi:hypothetical protein